MGHLPDALDRARRLAVRGADHLLAACVGVWLAAAVWAVVSLFF